MPRVRGGALTQAGIALERVSLTYRGRKGSTEALAGLDLVVEPRTFVSVLGPSGCGKSTILKLVSGLLPATTGSARVGGRLIDGPHRDVGIVFQKPTLLPWKSVLANILVAAPRAGEDRAHITGRARALIRLVRLEGFENHYPNELSGGMQQRVALARALLLDPPVLLMDEPFAALDALTRERMALELLKVWSQNAKTVLFVTHSIPEAVFLSDRVVILSPRPTHVVEEVAIDLPRPRDLSTMAGAAFGSLCDQLRQRLLDSAGDERERV
ncbi:MAG: ABC transporter ATP-binding protein [Betaproteobacteria bacterium]|nr:ABC transporter ATP-binding protein [Betaproteobacteria bacterium]